MQDTPPIRTIWRTTYECCEIVWVRFAGYHLRLWVRNNLVVDELITDIEAAIERGWRLRTEWPQLVGE